MRDRTAVTRNEPRHVHVRAARARIAAGLVALTLGAALLAFLRYRFGAVLDDLEGPLRPVEWTFSPGSEFRGAKGFWRRSRSAAYRGSFGGEIAFDFSQWVATCRRSADLPTKSATAV